MEYAASPGTEGTKEFYSRGFPSPTERRSEVVSGKASDMSATLPQYLPAHTRANHILCPTTRGYCDEKGSTERNSERRTKQVGTGLSDNGLGEDQEGGEDLRLKTDRCRGKKVYACASANTPLH